ncbi:MAG: hypothetical protein OXT69_14110 [Candidatus Poribacteria bacterium]|nr:hypothetical protein [Candidatus Poribacteria bacterium]
MRLSIIFAVLAAVILAAFVVLYFVIAGGSGDELENGLSVEDQSPRIEQSVAEEPTQTADETSAPERQEEAPILENAEAEESASPSDDSVSAGATQSDASQAGPQDPFTVELLEALEEFTQFADSLRSRFPNNPMSVFVVDVVGRLSDELTRYDEQLLSQNLTREKRIAKLKERAEQITDQADEPEFDIDDPALAASMEEMGRYMEANMPRKLMTLLGLDW